MTNPLEWPYNMRDPEQWLCVAFDGATEDGVPRAYGIGRTKAHAEEACNQAINENRPIVEQGSGFASEEFAKQVGIPPGPLVATIFDFEFIPPDRSKRR
jgi:hypothetical protein